MHGSIVGPGVDAADLYVGLTRGQHVNKACLLAGDDATAEAQISPSHTQDKLQTIRDNADRLEHELRQLRQARNDANSDARRSKGPSAADIDALQMRVDDARTIERSATKAAMPELPKLDAIHAERIIRGQVLDAATATRESRECHVAMRRGQDRLRVEAHAAAYGPQPRTTRPQTRLLR